MHLALSVKNKVGFIDGSLPQPPLTDSHLQLWTRSNNIVISWIFNSVSKEIVGSILHSTVAAEIWRDLRERFQQSNGPRIFELRRDLMRLSQGSDSVSVYFTKLKAITDELNSYKPSCDCSCGALRPWIEHQHTDHVMCFLMGLHDKFSSIRGQLLLADPIPPINKVFSLVVQEEKQLELGHQSPDPVAFSVHNNSVALAVKLDSKSSSKGPICSNCGISGHTVERCYKIIGYPPHYKKKGKGSKGNVNAVFGAASEFTSKSTSDSKNDFPMEAPMTQAQYHHLLSLLSGSKSASQDSPMTPQNNDVHALSPTGIVLSTMSKLHLVHDCWIIDSGATSHICHVQSLFHDYKPLVNSYVILPNQSRVNVLGYGSILLTKKITLHNVLFIPSFSFNLLSVSSLLRNSTISMLFLANVVCFQDRFSLMTIGKGEVAQGLYVFKPPYPRVKSYAHISPSTVPAQTAMPLMSLNNVTCNVNNVNNATCNVSSILNKSVPFSVWHARLGHLSKSAISILIKEQLLSVSDSTKHNCLICPLAKQPRLPFQSNNHFTHAIFDLIHCDVWGPFRHKTHMNQRYFLTIVDDFSRYTWTILLSAKSEATKIIQQFFTFVKVQFNKTVKCIRTDNAKELLLTDFLLEKGCTHQFSCVERPEQNSVVERKHRHLLNVARSLMFQSKVPITFWGECVLTACFLINRTPSKILQNKSPYERLFSKPPSYDSLKIFGTLCFASTLPSKRHKFSPRATAAVFVGYPAGIKGYKVYDLATKRFFVSRDIVFHETFFPFHDMNASKSNVDPFQHLSLPLISTTGLESAPSGNTPELESSGNALEFVSSGSAPELESSGTELEYTASTTNVEHLSSGLHHESKAPPLIL